MHQERHKVAAIDVSVLELNMLVVKIKSPSWPCETELHALWNTQCVKVTNFACSARCCRLPCF